jgi:septum site-determining protein MinC
VQKKLVNEAPRAIDSAVVNSALWDDADTRIICRTLRSGQKIETEHSLLIVGDVNSGAELVAGGDIVVLGAMRGVAHAGAFDETGGGRFIFALDLQPTQLRIGSIISRGSGSNRANGPEIAKVDGNIIVVETYSNKALLGMRR